MDVEADVRQSQAKTEKTVEGGVGGKALFVVRVGGEKRIGKRERDGVRSIRELAVS